MIKALLFDLGDTLISEIPEGTPKPDRDAQPNIIKVEGADEVLRELKRRYKLGLITNTTHMREKDVREALASVNLELYFDVIVTSVDVGSNKPDSRIFNEILQRLEVKPEEAVMVGNRYEVDILGAKRLGMKTIILQWNDRYRTYPINDEEAPTFKANSMKEVLKATLRLDHHRM